jgi:lipopolysaccharide/colanic/teichoic acid biosynthesis glycosyltransferase
MPVYDACDPNLLDEIAHWWIDDVFLLLDENTPYPRRLAESFLLMGITVHTSLSVLDELPYSTTDVQDLGEYKVLTNSIKFVSTRASFIKRLIDILAGLAGVTATGVIFLFVAPAIYLKSPGPIFFAQNRIGQNGRIFKMYKFRSMYMDAEKRKQELMEKNKIQGGLMFKMDDDPRIIGSEKKGRDGKPKGIGNFIRNTSLDEFPQFFNVLKGDMSLIGTRPPTVDEWNRYDPQHRIRMSAKPGITGMWQVSGRSKITAFEEVVRLDEWYIRNWSWELDVRILFKTVGVVLRHEGAE